MAQNKKRQPASKPDGRAPTKTRSGNASPGQRGAAKRAERERVQKQAELKRKGSWAVLFAGAAVIIAIIALSVKSSVDSSNEGVADATAWELPSLYEGDDITLASLRGKPVVLNFFASWCTACEAELPAFRSAVEQYGDQVEFVFIDSQDSDRLGKDMAERHGIDGLTIGKDFGSSNSSLFRTLGGRGMPITAFYDADGSLRFISSGAMVDGRLLDALQEFGYV